MSFIRKPTIDLPGQVTNSIGLLKRDYEGVMSTLCAGCGHDSITAAIVQAFWGVIDTTGKSHQAVRYRLFVENTGLFPFRCTWFQFRSWPHAFGGYRRPGG